MNESFPLTIRADRYATSGNDYYQYIAFPTPVIYLIPVGAVRGTVKDSLDNVVPHANLKFDCSSGSLQADTDEFGSFFIDYLPLGSCTVYAQYKKGTGKVYLSIEQGNLTDIDIVLDRNILASEGSGWLMPLLIIIGILAVLMLAVLMRKKSHVKESKEMSAVSEKPITHSSEKILQTLTQKEQEVVRYLLDHQNASAQSHIRHSLRVPRTTLSRLIISLANKKIVSVEKNGKSVIIRLTDFFICSD